MRRKRERGEKKRENETNFFFFFFCLLPKCSIRLLFTERQSKKKCEEWKSRVQLQEHSFSFIVCVRLFSLAVLLFFFPYVCVVVHLTSANTEIRASLKKKKIDRERARKREGEREEEKKRRRIASRKRMESTRTLFLPRRWLE